VGASFVPWFKRKLSFFSLDASFLAKKRFYQDVSVVHSAPEEYELTLDARKLKTPMGNVFKVKYKRKEAIPSQ
jgi:chaperone required for assembly of F1-ATPase